MGHVHDGVHTLGMAVRKVILVSRDGELVTLYGVGVAAHALIDVRRHVYRMPRRRHKGTQGIRRLLRPLRRIRWLDEVNVEMHRSGMLRIALHDRLGKRHDFRGSLKRISIPHPVTPGVEIHHRLDIEHRDIEVVRKACMHFPHGIRVGFVVCLALPGFTGIALFQRTDKRTLPWRGLVGHQRCGFLHELQSRHLVLRLHLRIDVGPKHKGLTPICHR